MARFSSRFDLDCRECAPSECTKYLVDENKYLEYGTRRKKSGKPWASLPTLPGHLSTKQKVSEQMFAVCPARMRYRVVYANLRFS